MCFEIKFWTKNLNKMVSITIKIYILQEIESINIEFTKFGIKLDLE